MQSGFLQCVDGVPDEPLQLLNLPLSFGNVTLRDTEGFFVEIRPYLEPEQPTIQLPFEIMD